MSGFINNSKKNIYSRVVQLFPAKAIKETFDIRTRSVGVVEDAVGNFTNSQIEKFVAQHVFLTRQHVYVFDLDRKYRARLFKAVELPYDIIHDDVDDGWRTLVLLAPVEYRVVMDGEPPVKETLKCAQPIVVRLKDEVLVVHTTVMERNASSFINIEKEDILNSKRLVDESVLVEGIATSILDIFGGAKRDLTAGAKKLMELDIIDGTSVKHRTENSISTEIMDESYTIKKDRPVLYQDMIKNRLENTSFRYQKDDDELPRKFLTMPEKGFLAFSSFPTHEKQVKNVVDELLKYN